MSARRHLDAADAHDALLVFFKTQWGTTIPVQYENKRLLKDQNAHDVWLDFSIEIGDQFEKGVSDAPEYRTVGRMVFDTFSKKNLGQTAFLQTLKALTDILRGQNIEGVRVGAPIVSPPIGNDTWHNKVISFPFNFDDK